MPKADIVPNSKIYKKPIGGDSMSNNCTCNKPSNECTCGCQDNNNNNNCYPLPWWCPPPQNDCNCVPPYPYPYPTPPVNAGVGSVEAQIAKLSKKSACIRKMIDNLVNRNKSIVISIGCGASYNFGTYQDKEGAETDYGKAVLEMLQTELEAIKAKIIELTSDLEVEDEVTGGLEETVTTL